VDAKTEVALTRVPDPRRGRSSALFRTFRSLLVSFLLALLVIAVGIYYAKRAFDRAGPLTGVGAVVVERGMNAEDIANRLKEKGVIAHPYAFILAAAYARLRGHSLKAGEYEFPAAASLRQVLDMITEGKALTYRLSIPEGLTTEQIIERLNAQGALVEEAPVGLAEGVLLPDTYTFTRGTSRAELLERMQEAQRKVVDELWDGRSKGLPVKTKEEAVILASIVEKETSRPAERARVAGVFVNRLKRSMRLQSDPTIIYGLVGGKGRLDRPISRDDIAQKTATTPIGSMACRRPRSPIPGARRSAPCSIRPRPRTSISSPTAAAGTSSRER
jgi:peptidoglycan lytic transglycosylase G